MLVTIVKCQNGFMNIADGQFMYESEVEDAHFKLVDIELPELD
jgi:hypothetical protein